MTDRDIRMLKGIEFLIENGSFTLKQREARALIAIEAWLKEKIELGIEKPKVEEPKVEKPKTKKQKRKTKKGV